jgi:methionine-rich copper-binding protein CopC
MKRSIKMVFIIGLVAGISQRAMAHAQLDKSTPRVGETVKNTPQTVTITFTEELKPDGSAIQVFDAQGKQVDKGDSHLDDHNKAVMAVSLKEIGAGQYTVKWHALCIYEHHTEGSFHFSIDDGGTARGD